MSRRRRSTSLIQMILSQLFDSWLYLGFCETETISTKKLYRGIYSIGSATYLRTHLSIVSVPRINVLLSPLMRNGYNRSHNLFRLCLEVIKYLQKMVAKGHVGAEIHTATLQYEHPENVLACNMNMIGLQIYGR